jgi:hypothetical protein
MISLLALQPHGHASSGVEALLAQALLVSPGIVWSSAFSCMKHLSKTGCCSIDHCIEAPLSVASTLYVLETWRSL